MFSAKITYTITDEAPMLATYSLLPIIRRFTQPVGINIDTIDISVAARILSKFPERLTEAQRVPDTLAQLGKLVLQPDANVIKLPNISASVPQLNAAIKELQSQGYNVPDFPQDPKTAEEKEIAARYAKVLGSAVNPVLREGNSDRRVAAPVKAYARKNPHELGAWARDCQSRVAHMTSGDYYGSEQSHTTSKEGTVSIEFVPAGGAATVLKTVKLKQGEIIDAAVMSAAKLKEFYEQQFALAKKEGLLASLHLKATMMKVSDPVFFGHAVKAYFKDIWNEARFKEFGINANNGFGDLLAKMKKMPEAEQQALAAGIQKCYANGPDLAMVDSKKGITNLHVPSNVIIDASMPCVVRDSGKMWNKHNQLQDTLCIIPDRCYAGIYDVMMKDCLKNGQFNVKTMGSTANVGLMAQAAEEYGSHDKTFEMSGAGKVLVKDDAGVVIFEHAVQKGDMWRMCQTKDAPVKDWVKLAVTRARLSGHPAIFWLDSVRAHDRQLTLKVKKYLKDHDLTGLDITIQTPEDAMRTTCARARAGKDSISVTGNVLRDYLTDLFPILELASSSKMLSIVPMMTGGAMFETGAGGSAPKHVEQFLTENHLRWDSLGEYLALSSSLEDLATKTKDARIKNLSDGLTVAIGKLLDNEKSPLRKAKQLDNRGSSFYIALYWAQAMAEKDPSFKQLATELAAVQEKALKEMIDCQGGKVDIGGYYKPDAAKASAALRPSASFNALLDAKL
jgi:isocitrate dehydrogenase